MLTRIANLLRGLTARCHGVVAAGRTCTRDLPGHLIVLNDIYGVGDLSATRR